MKNTKSIIAACLCVFIAVCLFVLPSVAEVDKNSVEVTLTADKAEYAPEETMTTSLTLKNGGNSAIKNVTMTVKAPDGFTFIGGEQTRNVETLAAGESSAFRTQFKTPAEAVVPPDTGSAPIVLFAVFAVGAFAALVVLAVKNKKLRAGMLSMIICCFMIAGAVGVGTLNASAHEENATVKATLSVKVDGKEVKLQGVVSYVIETVQEENPVVTAINNLKQDGAYTAEDISAIASARAAYNALSEQEKAEIDNVGLLEAAEAKMLTIFDFNADNMSNFNAGLYGANSACQVQVGYTTDTIGGVGGAGWFSTAIKEGEFLLEADTNNNGYADDDASSYIGTHFRAAHAKSAYQALLDDGYKTVTFNFYVTAAAGNVDMWSRFAEDAFYWLGSQPFNTWVTVELPLEKFVATYDGLLSDIYTIISANVNAATPLTTVYLTDIVIKDTGSNDYTTVDGLRKAIGKLKQIGAYTAEDVAAVLAARKAYNALSSEKKAAIDNISLLDAAEDKMLVIFDFNADNMSNFNAGLYGANSACQVQVGYTTDTVGGANGAGWFSTAIKEGAFLPEADTNGNGYADDDAASYIGTHFKAAHKKDAYQTLLDAGYATVTFNFYISTETGKVEVWSRFAEDAFYWLGSQPFGMWVTVELPLEKFVATYDGLFSDIYTIISANVNAATPLTTMYLTDIVIKSVNSNDYTTVNGIKKAINGIKQVGKFDGKDVETIFAARKAYNALSSEKKAAVDNIALLETAEARMLTVFDFNADSVAGFKAGLYGANSACQVQVGYTDEAIGGVSGTGWFSSAIKEGAFIVSEDTNGNGYADDNASSYVGTNFDPLHAKSAYQALLDAGYTTVSFKIYVTAEAGNVDAWSRYADEAGCFFWFGSQPFDTWIDVNIPLDKFVEKYDVTRGDMFSLISFNVNAATPLTTVYVTDVAIA